MKHYLEARKYDKTIHMSSQNFISLDIGQARIGLASGSVKSGFVFGRGYIERTDLKTDISLISELMKEENATSIVVGLPIKSDGFDSKQTQRVRAFARSLQSAGFDVIFEDERYSSKIAKSSLLASGLSKKKRREKGLVDEAAAIVILENYLTKQKEGNDGFSRE